MPLGFNRHAVLAASRRQRCRFVTAATIGSQEEQHSPTSLPLRQSCRCVANPVAAADLAAIAARWSPARWVTGEFTARFFMPVSSLAPAVLRRRSVGAPKSPR